MFSESAFDLWLWQHVMWGCIYACVFLRWSVAYGFMISWEVWEAVGRVLVPDDGIFGPESWANILLDIAAAGVAFHATAWLLAALPRLWTHADPATAPTVGTTVRRSPADAEPVPDNV